MRRFRPQSWWAALVGWALACAGVLPGASSDLVANSPFVPPGTAAGPAAGEGGNLELRSVMSLGGAPQFSIFDTATKRATWVGLNDRSQEFVVKNYDANADTVNVEYRGRTMTLALQKAKISAAPATAVGAAPVPSVPTLPAPPPALVNTVKTNPTPAEEAARLQAVVEEIRRRREQRQQPGSTPMPGAQVQPVPPAPVSTPIVPAQNPPPAGPRPMPAPGQTPPRRN